MKDLFKNQYHLTVGRLWERDKNIYTLKWPTPSTTYLMKKSELITMILDGIRVFKDFSYTKTPSTADFNMLEVARRCFLSGYALFKWPLTPTTHYLMTHTIDNAYGWNMLLYTSRRG